MLFLEKPTARQAFPWQGEAFGGLLFFARQQQPDGHAQRQTYPHIVQRSAKDQPQRDAQRKVFALSAVFHCVCPPFSHSIPYDSAKRKTPVLRTTGAIRGIALV